MKNREVFFPHWILAGVLLVLLLVHGIASAKCITNDKWWGEDKAMHLALGTGVGMVAAAQTNDYWTGVKWATAAAAGKEVLDAASGSGTCSLQDFAVTVMGGAIGSAIGVQIAVTRQRNTTTVWLNKEF